MNSRPFRMFPQLAVAGVALVLSPNAVLGAERRIVCPPTLAPGTVQGKAPTGWHFAMPHAAQLTGAGMLHGLPEESGYLVPQENKDTKQGWTQRWSFARPHWYPTFAYCAYGGGTLQLFHAIPTDATECRATGRRKGSVLEQVVFVCW